MASTIVEKYHAAMRMAKERDLQPLFSYQETDEAKILTICNLWRVIRYRQGDVFQALQYDLSKDQWMQTDKYSGPRIPLYVANNRKQYINSVIAWTIAVIISALRSILEHFELPSDVIYYNDEVFNEDDEELERQVMKIEREAYEAPSWFKPEKYRKKTVAEYIENPLLLSRRFVRFFLGAGRSSRLKLHQEGGLLNKGILHARGKLLRGTIYNHFYDKQISSALLAIDHKSLSFGRYLNDGVSNRNGLLKVAHEHRNLLPLLPAIRPERWTEDDLFAKKTWVRQGRLLPLVDKGKFWSENPRRKRLALLDPASWKWLMSAPSSVVGEWAQKNSYRSCNPKIIYLLAHSKTPQRVACIVYRHLVRFFPEQMLDAYQEQWPLTVLRLYLSETSRLWEKESFRWLYHRYCGSLQAPNQLHDVIDYLVAVGLEAGPPDKNSTWRSLVRRTEEWHGELAAKKIEDQENVVWKAVTPESVINGIKFTPITNYRALLGEGAAMRHCVSSYIDDCLSGAYHVFSLEGSDGYRATLGLKKSQGKKLVMDQVRGVCNEAVPPGILEASHKFISLVNQ